MSQKKKKMKEKNKNKKRSWRKEKLERPKILQRLDKCLGKELFQF